MNLTGMLYNQILGSFNPHRSIADSFDQAPLFEFAGDTGVMAGSVDYQLCFQGNRVDTGYFPGQRLDGSPVDYNSSYSVSFSKDYVLKHGHIGKFHSRIACCSYEF